MSNKISSLGTTQSKETIYVDVEDDITSIIERVTSSKSKIVALVLPKRASVMQSTVNMKLLKRSAENSGKNVALVTNEPSLMPLAGLVGMHVAETPTSKPIIPPAPTTAGDEADDLQEPLMVTGDADKSSQEDFDAKTAATTSVGALADQSDDGEAIVMNDQTEQPASQPTAATGAATATAAAARKPKKDKKLAVPNFNKFRLGIVLVVLAMLLIGGGLVYAFVVMPKATVAITTDSQTVSSDLELTLSTEAQKMDEDKLIIPAEAQSMSKSYSQDAPATGQRNDGEKAAGSFAAINCTDNAVTIPAGSAVSAGGKTYIVQETTKVPGSNFTSGGVCKNDGKASVDIEALRQGTEYNVSGATFSSSSIKGTGSASGGTDQIVKIVSQGDIDNAKSKIANQDTMAIKNDLSAALKGKNLMPVVSTFLPGDQEVTTNAKAGDAADSVRVTATVPYTMLGVKENDLRKLVMNNVEKEIDTKKQKISDDGVKKVVFSQESAGSSTVAQVLAKVKSTAGPEINVSQLKKDVGGKKVNDVREMLKSTPGITDVQVEYSPGWVSRVPKNTEKITVTIDGEVR